jgi:hypothetical protein
MGNLCAGGPSEAPTAKNVPLMSEYDEESEGGIRGGAKKMRGGAEMSNVGSASSGTPWWPTGLLGFLAFIAFLAVAGMALYAFAFVVDNKSNIENGVPCSTDKVSEFSLDQRFPEAIRTDWRSQSRDLYSSSHNGHLPNLGTNIRKAVGFCPGLIDHISATPNGVGITVTPTVDTELGLLFFSDHGFSSNHTDVTIYAVRLSTCEIAWSQTLTNYTQQAIAVAQSNGDDAGIYNPYADMYSSIQIGILNINVKLGLKALVFGDMGTSSYYNLSMCDTVSCGARIFILNPSNGNIYSRLLIEETTPAVVNYTRYGDQIRVSPQIYRNVAYFGTTSNQSMTVVNDGILNFYGVIGAVDFNRRNVVFVNPINRADQINDDNIGVGIEGTPVIDLDTDLVIYGSTYAYNQSTTIINCLTAEPNTPPYSCSGNLNNNQLFAIDTNIATTFGDASVAQWRYSPYGADAWTAGCLTGSSYPCPEEAGPYFGYFAGSLIVKNQCGQRYVISVGQSGTMYANDAQTGLRRWSTYLGPSSNQTATYGMSFDGKYIWTALGNLDKKSYLTLDGTKRCDSMWIKVDAWTGVIADIIPVPCSRASSECPDIVPDPFLMVYYPTNILDFSNRGTEKAAPAVSCPTTDPLDSRQGSFGAIAVGPVITTNNLMLAGSFSGHMHAYDLHGKYIYSLPQCDTGIVFGGASASLMTDGSMLVSYGCGYGTGPYPAEFGDSQLKMFRIG